MFGVWGGHPKILAKNMKGFAKIFWLIRRGYVCGSMNKELYLAEYKAINTGWLGVF